MRCDICDREMTDKEIQFNEDLADYEPCTTCLDIAMDAAYTGGFKTVDDVYDIIDEEFDDFDSYETYGTQKEVYRYD